MDFGLRKYEVCLPIISIMSNDATVAEATVPNIWNTL